MSGVLPPDDFAQPPSLPPRRRVLRLLQRGFHRTGLDSFYVHLTGCRGVVALLYHSVPEPEAARFIVPHNRMESGLFVRQMEFIARHRRVLNIDGLLSALEGKLDPEPGSVVLTFDDGYRDNADFVAPLLSSLGLPATLFLPTHLISRGEASWVDRLYSAFRYRSRHQLDLSEFGFRRFSLDGVSDRRDAFAALSSRLISASLEVRDSLMARVVDLLAPRDMPQRLLMNWNEVRDLRQRYPLFHLGVHGAEHLDLTSQPEDVVRREISDCQSEFESELGEKAIDLAFPYNRSNETVCALLAEYGFRLGMSGGDTLLSTSANPLQLPRFDAPYDLGLLGHWTSGAHPMLSKKLLRRP